MRVVGGLHALLARLAADHVEEGDHLGGARQSADDIDSLGIPAPPHLVIVEVVDLQPVADQGESVLLERHVVRRAGVMDPHPVGLELEGRAFVVLAVQHRPFAGPVGEPDHRLDVGRLDIGQGHGRTASRRKAAILPLSHRERKGPVAQRWEGEGLGSGRLIPVVPNPSSSHA